MQQMRSEAMEKLEDEYREKFSAQQSELNEEREKWELKNATLMQELDAVTTDRESILNQAEGLCRANWLFLAATKCPNRF